MKEQAEVMSHYIPSQSDSELKSCQVIMIVEHLLVYVEKIVCANVVVLLTIDYMHT